MSDATHSPVSACMAHEGDVAATNEGRWRVRWHPARVDGN